MRWAIAWLIVSGGVGPWLTGQAVGEAGAQFQALYDELLTMPPDDAAMRVSQLLSEDPETARSVQILLVREQRLYYTGGAGHEVLKGQNAAGRLLLLLDRSVLHVLPEFARESLPCNNKGKIGSTLFLAKYFLGRSAGSISESDEAMALWELVEIVHEADQCSTGLLEPTWEMLQMCPEPARAHLVAACVAESTSHGCYRYLAEGTSWCGKFAIDRLRTGRPGERERAAWLAARAMRNAPDPDEDAWVDVLVEQWKTCAVSERPIWASYFGALRLPSARRKAVQFICSELESPAAELKGVPMVMSRLRGDWRPAVGRSVTLFLETEAGGYEDALWRVALRNVGIDAIGAITERMDGVEPAQRARLEGLLLEVMQGSGF